MGSVRAKRGAWDSAGMERADGVIFGLTVFIGAFLLFEMQPLISKYTQLD